MSEQPLAPTAERGEESRREKRRQILDAAARVFARKGFHTCRVGDIAAEAGVSHGLLYYYFRSKDEVLEAIFAETWSGLLESIAAVEASDAPTREQLARVAGLFLRSWRHMPDVVRVVVQEIGRTRDLGGRAAEFHQVGLAIERILRRGQERGEVRTDIDARLASTVFYGGIDELLTAWVFGIHPDGDDQVAAAEQALLDVTLGGLLAD